MDDYQTNYKDRDTKADGGEVEVEAEGLEGTVDQGVSDLLGTVDLTRDLAANSEVRQAELNCDLKYGDDTQE